MPNKTKPAKKDLKSCLIIAGRSGAGKSTIIKCCHALDVKIFGEDFHEDFKKTISSYPHREFEHFTDAIANGATFEGRHINDLNSEKYPPKHILMHVDLKLLITTLGYRVASERDKKKIKDLTKFPVPQRDRSDSRICSLMISSFLKHDFFSRFERIAVNTLQIDHNSNYLQEAKRDHPKRNIKHKKASDRYAQEHRAMYKAWEKNIYRIRPSKILFTTINQEGDLYSNNHCLYTNWKEKIKPNYKEKSSLKSWEKLIKPLK